MACAIDSCGSKAALGPGSWAATHDAKCPSWRDYRPRFCSLENGTRDTALVPVGSYSSTIRGITHIRFVGDSLQRELYETFVEWLETYRVNASFEHSLFPVNLKRRVPQARLITNPWSSYGASWFRLPSNVSFAVSYMYTTSPLGNLAWRAKCPKRSILQGGTDAPVLCAVPNHALKVNPGCQEVWLWKCPRYLQAATTILIFAATVFESPPGHSYASDFQSLMGWASRHKGPVVYREGSVQHQTYPPSFGLRARCLPFSVLAAHDNHYKSLQLQRSKPLGDQTADALRLAGVAHLDVYAASVPLHRAHVGEVDRCSDGSTPLTERNPNITVTDCLHWARPGLPSLWMRLLVLRIACNTLQGSAAYRGATSPPRANGVADPRATGFTDAWDFARKMKLMQSWHA